MTTIEGATLHPGGVVAAIERGLDRMLTSPTYRLRAVREELEREVAAQQFQMDATLRETRETLEMATRYLQNLPNS